jgi:hypothetical protein
MIKPIAAKGLFTVNTIKHNHSFPGDKNMYEQKFICGWAKCESVAVNILVLSAMQQIFRRIWNS